MITRALRGAMKRDEGQALVLACLMMLVLSIAVITTVNVGHNIHERQRLQNNADAAAYSMAALEARAFNFYAFVNRTHVSHYVTAMVWQSIVSFVYFVEAMMVDVLGVIETVDCRDEGWVVGTVCELVKSFNSTVKMVYDFIGQFRMTYVRVLVAVLTYLRIADPDHAIGTRIVPTYFAMNAMLTASAQATLKATLREVELTSMDVVLANDRNVDFSSARLASGRLSQCMLARAHQREAWHGSASEYPYAEDLRPLEVEAHRDNDKVSRSKRAMGAVSNSTRFALDQKNNPQELPGPGWVTSRRLSDLVYFPPSFQSVHDVLVKYVDNPDAPGNVNFALGKWGQTKMLTADALNGRVFRFGGFSAGGNRIRHWEDPKDFPWGEMAQGDELGSDDLYRINIGSWNDRWEVLGQGFNNRNLLACRPEDPPEECWGDNRFRPDEPKHLLFKNMLKTSVWSKPDQTLSIHYRLVSMPNGKKFPDQPGAVEPINWNTGDPGKVCTDTACFTYAQLGLSRIDMKFSVLGIGFTLHKYVANVRGVRDGNHWWPGVAPFPHFEPGQYEKGCDAGPVRPALFKDDRAAALREQDFNQPSTFAMLEKTPEQLLNAGDTTGAGNNRPALLSASGGLDFRFSKQSNRLVLDNTRKEFLGTPGLHVISRGQTYYHRPGNWSEHANFFNPYWRPRLGSVLLGDYGNPMVDTFVKRLPSQFDDMPQRAITH